jgi:thiosulfate/3-mercaptopyruvate sulfurtransferase
MIRLGVFYLVLLAIPAASFTTATLAGEDKGFDTTGVPRVSTTTATEPPAPKEFARPDALMSTDTLGKLLAAKDPKLVIIDARPDSDYIATHILGARNIPSDALQDPSAPPYFMPSVEALKAVCADVGINADSTVVIYDEDDGRLAARVWFTLHARGHEHVAILDGGVTKWHDERRPWVTDIPTRATPGTFEPAATVRGACTFDDLPQFRTRSTVLGKLPAVSLIDARAMSEYTGEDVRGKIGGHIPGAANIEWCNLMSGQEHARVWRSPPEIHALLRVTGIEKDQKICIYDQAGGRSAHIYFTLWLMGFDHACNYVGGWREYTKKDGIEIEK